MAIFGTQIETIKRQLSGLEPSQRVALGLCVVVISGAIFMLTQWSLQREMVPLYAEKLTDEQLESAARQLQMMREDYELRDDDIYVRPVDQRRLIMALNARNSGPRDLSITFETLLKDNDNFASTQTTQYNQNIALSNELALMIQSWPKITEARVQIAPETRRRLNKATMPTAIVQVRMAQGTQMGKGIVESLARLVSGAVPGLQPQNVSVVDLVAGRSYVVDDQEDRFSSTLYDLQRRREAELKSKIEDLLSYVPGLIAQVRLKLDDQNVSRVDTELDEPAVRREVKEETSQTNQSSAQEPGVSANTGVALAGAGSGQSSSNEKTETEYMQERGGSVTQTQKKPGTVLKAAASIGVPRSYFVAAVKALAGDSDTEPTVEQVDAYIDEQIPEIEKQVKPLLDANAEVESTVVVSVYADRAVEYIQQGPLEGSEKATSVVDFVSAHGKQLGLLAMVAVAMGMMMLMVRKGGAATVAPGLDEQEAVPSGPLGEFYVDEGAVGKAGSPDAFLIAQETDENSIRLRQISQQVTDLIEDDPEGAAQLVRRWIEREL